MQGGLLRFEDRKEKAIHVGESLGLLYRDADFL